jgi:predicted amidohydrolase
MIGLGICYDIRFPEYSMLLRKAGMEIMTYPSAFTVKTGAAHWDILLRCRAIETQSYVIAAAQYGKHNQVRESYGNAHVLAANQIVDPWGVIVASCGSQPNSFAIADINLDYLHRIRNEMPVMQHRRTDLYKLVD